MERLTFRNGNGIGWPHELSIWKLASKLADYEDAEEEGRLIEFPVAIGDHLWEIEYYKELNISSIKEFIVNTLEIDSDSFIWSNVSEINPSYDYDSSCFNLSSLYGKCVFSSLEEAEAKLKEMEDKGND